MRVRRMIDHGGTGRNSFFEKDTVRASVAFLAQDAGTKNLVYCFYIGLYSLTGPGQAPEGRDRGNFFIVEAQSRAPEREKSPRGVAWTPRSHCCPSAPTSASRGRGARILDPRTQKGPLLGAGLGLAGGRGFEPRLTESESAVLPLDDPPKGDAGRVVLNLGATHLGGR